MFDVGVKLDGQQATVRAVLDGNPVYTWTGSISDLAVEEPAPFPGRPAIGAWVDEVRFENVRSTSRVVPRVSSRQL